MTARPALRADGGFTLVELLVTAAIAGLVMPVLTGALLIGWRTTDETVASLSDSRNRLLLPSTFTRDVQSAGSVDTSTADSTCTQAGDTVVVRLRWTEIPASGPPVAQVAAYVTRAGSGETLLERRYCDDSTGTMALRSSVSLVHGVAGTPSVTCRDAAGATVGCAAARSVSVSVTDGSGALTASARRRST